AGLGGVRGSPAASSPSQPEPLASSHLAYPMGSALSSSGDLLFVADTFNNVVRAIDLKHRTVWTVAGTPGKAGYSGDNGPATNALLSYPTGLAVDATGNLFIADTYNGRVRARPLQRNPWGSLFSLRGGAGCANAPEPVHHR
ncbi:MAG: hypothetical protein E6I84_15565, partial [Chloroflexi bacterium]